MFWSNTILIAIALPMPRLEPVTTATLPESSNMLMRVAPRAPQRVTSLQEHNIVPGVLRKVWSFTPLRPARH